MKNFFKKLRKRKFIRVISKILLVLFILILLLGWFILFLIWNKWLKICYKSDNFYCNENFGHNVRYKQKICEEYKININQKLYDENNLLMEENNSINWTENWPFFYYYEWKLILKWQIFNWKLVWNITSYYENWNIKEESNYNNWKINWKYFEYYENWNLKAEWNYENWEKVWIRNQYLEDWTIRNFKNYDE